MITNPHAQWMPIARHDHAPAMKPRVIILHTNAASVPASLQAAWNVANAGGGNTQPHFQVQMDGTAGQFLETDETGVASFRANDFSIAIETQDQGYPTPGDVPWADPQLDRIAKIVAQECARWQIPVRPADRWDGSGIGWHSMWGINQTGKPPVNPWTKTVGKTCPGAARIAQFPALLDRVRAILNPPKPTPTPNPDPTGGKMLALYTADGKVWLTDHLTRRDVTALQQFYIAGSAIGGLDLGPPKPASTAFLATIVDVTPKAA